MQMTQIEVDQCEAYIKQLKDQPELDQLRNDNKVQSASHALLKQYMPPIVPGFCITSST